MKHWSIWPPLSSSTIFSQAGASIIYAHAAQPNLQVKTRLVILALQVFECCWGTCPNLLSLLQQHLQAGCGFLPDPRWASPECLRSSAAPSCNFHGPSARRRRSKCGRTGGCLSRFPDSFPPGRRVHRTRTCGRDEGIINMLIVVIVTTTTSSVISRQTGSSPRRRAVTGTCKLDAWKEREEQVATKIWWFLDFFIYFFKKQNSLTFEERVLTTREEKLMWHF